MPGMHERILVVLALLALSLGFYRHNHTLPTRALSIQLVKNGITLDAALVAGGGTSFQGSHLISVWGHRNTRFVLKMVPDCSALKTDDIDIFPTGIFTNHLTKRNRSINANVSRPASIDSPFKPPGSRRRFRLQTLSSVERGGRSKRPDIYKKAFNPYEIANFGQFRKKYRKRRKPTTTEKTDHTVTTESSVLKARLNWMEQKRLLFEKKMEMFRNYVPEEDVPFLTDNVARGNSFTKNGLEPSITLNYMMQQKPSTSWYPEKESTRNVYLPSVKTMGGKSSPNQIISKTTHLSSSKVVDDDNIPLTSVSINAKYKPLHFPHQQTTIKVTTTNEQREHSGVISLVSTGVMSSGIGFTTTSPNEYSSDSYTSILGYKYSDQELEEGAEQARKRDFIILSAPSSSIDMKDNEDTDEINRDDTNPTNTVDIVLSKTTSFSQFPHGTNMDISSTSVNSFSPISKSSITNETPGMDRIVVDDNIRVSTMVSRIMPSSSMSYVAPVQTASLQVTPTSTKQLKPSMNSHYSKAVLTYNQSSSSLSYLNADDRIWYKRTRSLLNVPSVTVSPKTKSSTTLISSMSNPVVTQLKTSSDPIIRDTSSPNTMSTQKTFSNGEDPVSGNETISPVHRHFGEMILNPHTSQQAHEIESSGSTSNAIMNTTTSSWASQSVSATIESATNPSFSLHSSSVVKTTRLPKTSSSILSTYHKTVAGNSTRLINPSKTSEPTETSRSGQIPNIANSTSEPHENNTEEDISSDTLWPVVAALVVGIPSVIVFGIAITVIHRRRLAQPIQTSITTSTLYPSL